MGLNQNKKHRQATQPPAVAACRLSGAELWFKRLVTWALHGQRQDFLMDLNRDFIGLNGTVWDLLGGS